MGFFTGSDASQEQRSKLTRDQERVSKTLNNAALQSGAGGAYGDAADYYRDLLSDNSTTANMMFAPEMRRYNEQIIPGLAEQFAGMGSGALSSSGFRNAGIQAGTDLSERLGKIRADLRAQGAAGLTGIGNESLRPTIENTETTAQPGLLEGALPSLIGGAATAIGGGLGSAAFGGLSNFMTKNQNKNPYAGQGSNVGKPQVGSNISGGYGLPTFMGR